MGVYAELRGLQTLSQALDLPEDGFPLSQASPNLLWRTPSAEALDLSAKNIPVARGLAQDGIQSLVAVFQAPEQVVSSSSITRRRLVGSAPMRFIAPPFRFSVRRLLSFALIRGIPGGSRPLRLQQAFAPPLGIDHPD